MKIIDKRAISFCSEHIDVENDHKLRLPVGVKFLKVYMQDNIVFVLYMCDYNEVNDDDFEFKFYFTGEEIPDDHGEYLGTIEHNSIEYHVFVRES
jgi:hypothetical protein